MNKTKVFLKAWSTATVFTYFLAATFQTQVVLSGLTAIGTNIPVIERLHMTAWDWWGLLPKFGSAIAAAMLIAMLVVLFVHRLGGSMMITAAIGGGTAMLTLLAVMHPIMNVTLIAGTRGPMGIALQCLAGIIGGAIFAMLYPSTHKDKHTERQWSYSSGPSARTAK